MNNFYRAFRLTFRHRFLLALSLICATVVAILWGANIGGAYPIVEVIFQGQSLQQWVNSEIDRSDKEVAEMQAKIDKINQEAEALPADQKNTLLAQIGPIESRQRAEQSTADKRRWLKPYIDDYLPNDPFQTLVVIMMILLAGTILKDVFMVLDSILVDRLTGLAMLEMRKTFYRRTLRLDLADFGENGASELMSRFTYDMDCVGQGVQTLIGRAVREPLKMIACMAGAAWICWRLLVVSLILAPIAGWLIRRLAKALKNANRKAMEEVSQFYNILNETFSGIKVVKAFCAERQERRRFHENSKRMFRKGIVISMFDSLVSPLTEMMGISAICSTILAGAYLVLNHQTDIFGMKICDRPLTLGELLVFYALIIGTTDPVRKISDVFNRLQRAAAAADRVYAMMDREPKICDPVKSTPLPRHHREMVLENISFSYQPSQLVLEAINLKIKFGETIGIVGPNGCGKSTLANLIPRFYDPVQGRVLVDQVDLREVRLRELRQQIGIVTQETLLFDDTVYNNIRYGLSNVTREQVIAAAQKAHAHKFIETKLENGYDTYVGPSGNRLSGGQRQRIALARAILRDPAIMILDEATSQIDLESEQLIHLALEQFVQNRTTIIITHRLATIDLCDRVVVMDQGRILDVGTHSELLGRCDLYRRLYQIHFKESA